MKTSVDENGVFPRLAEGWLRQIRAIGQLANCGSWKDDRCRQDLTKRVAIAISILKALEISVDLRFSQERSAYCHALHEWPFAVGPGGYCNTGSIPASAHAMSLFTAWYSSIDGKSISHRLTRAAAWVALNNGFDSALDYLIDLIREGFVLNPNDCALAIGRLITGLSQEQGIDALTSFLFGQQTLTTTEWCRAPLVCPEVNLREPMLNGVGKRAAETLLTRALASVEEARDSLNLDQWLTRVCVVSKVCDAIWPVVKQFLTSSLHWNAVLIQLEEAACDAGAISMLSRNPGFEAPIWQKFKNAVGFLIMIESRDPSSWQERVLNERLILPRALAHSLAGRPRYLDNASIDKQDSWRRVSIEVFGAVCLSLLNTPVLFFQSDRLKDGPIGVTDVKGDDPIESFRRTIVAGMEAADLDPPEGVRLLGEASRIYPWADMVCAELGVAYDKSGNPAAALPLLEAAIIANPGQYQSWQSLGVVLRRLGHLAEAQVASAISRWIASEAKQGEAS